MTDAAPILDMRRPLGDVTLPGQATSAVVAVVALPSQLRRLAKMPVQTPPCLLVAPYVDVDRFVADRKLAAVAESARDLLWTPILSQLPLHESKARRGEVLVASSS